MEAPYAIVTINLLILLAYLLTYLLARFHFIRNSTHLRFWNVVLLTVLLSTGILGLILAIQVNLKITVSSTDRLLVWHVNSGIGLFIVAILHISHHWKYFTKLFKPELPAPIDKDSKRTVPAISHGMKPDTTPPSVKVLKMAIAATGVSAMGTQLILIKALLSVFSGNELVIGVMLANWMLLTGLGAFSANKRKAKVLSENSVTWGIALLSFIPLCLLFLLSFLRNMVFIPGSMVSIWQIAGATFILLAPYCLWSGYFFILLSNSLSGAMRDNRNRESYLLESIGGLLGGGLFCFIFVYYFQPFQSLILLALFNVTLVSYWMFITKRRNTRIPHALLIIPGLLLLWLAKPDLIATQLIYPGQRVIEVKDTPFSRLVVTRTNEQVNFYEDGNLLFANNNIITIEETVHYAMVQHPQPEKVLLIGGGMSGTVNEILKYPVKSLTYVELDPELIKLGEKYTNACHDKRLHLVTGDARILIRETSDHFDVAIIDQPPPLSMQVNRYYSLEFFKLLKSKLTPGAVLSFGLMPTAEYVSDEARQLHSVMFNTLKQIFRNVIVVTGDRNYMLASDGPLQSNITNLIRKRNIATEYVNDYYLDDQLLMERSRAVMKQIDIPAPVNHDLTPVAYYLQQNYWLSHFHTNLGLPLFLIIVLAFILIFRMNALQTSLFISGFSAASVEVLLILATQVLYGYIYRTTGIIITAFMAGLFLGAVYAGRKSNPRKTVIFHIQFLEGAFILVICLLLSMAEKVTTQLIFVWAGIPVLMLIMAFITGIQFGIASRIHRDGQVANLARLYSADLSGAAIGALLTATLLLPVFGFYNVLFLLAGINFAGGLIMSVNQKWKLLK